MPAAPRSTLACRTILLLLLATLSACSLPQKRCCVPTGLLTPEATVDLNSTSDRDYAVEHAKLAESLAHLKKCAASDQSEPARKYNVLALSGGGSYGAFSAGVLNGWTASGERPTLDIVSGVSTGALISTYAFLGSDYDSKLCDFYTNSTSADIYRKRPKTAVLWSDSAVSSAPLEQVIEETITPEILFKVALAHSQGRRLYVGTTNLDTGRLVIWDLGGIASSGRPNSLQLYRRVLLASASVPGFFPPVSIDVTVNGRKYTELHADGGATAQVFFRSSMIEIDDSHPRAGRTSLSGSRIYVIVAGKHFPDPQCVNDTAIKVASRALNALTHAQTRNDLVRIYTLTLLTGMDFRVTAIPQEMKIGDTMMFEPTEMRRLYNCGFELARKSQAWADVPPVLDASQQSIPRAGVDFLAPTQSVNFLAP